MDSIIYLSWLWVYNIIIGIYWSIYISIFKKIIYIIYKTYMLTTISRILVIIGALNWGLVGIGSFIGGTTNLNVVNLLLGSVSWLESIVYVLVGIAALVLIFDRK